MHIRKKKNQFAALNTGWLLDFSRIIASDVADTKKSDMDIVGYLRVGSVRIV